MTTAPPGRDQIIRTTPGMPAGLAAQITGAGQAARTPAKTRDQP